MLRRLLITLLTLTCTCASGLAAQQLDVYFIDVGQGDATLFVSPTGDTFLFDCGDHGQGSSTVVPLLNSLGINQLDYVSASHYHSDHIGGFDEVWNAGIHAAVALDRGTNNVPSTQAYTDYANLYRNVRQTVQPGQVVTLGGGVTFTCLVVEGKLLGGGTVNISNSAQWENSASLAWKVEYGDFDLYIGGDLTGGGNSTTDVENSVWPLCGDVDVYQVNHHGSLTSSNSNFVNGIKPEFVVMPCGSSNTYGYPKQEVLDRLNTPSWTIPVWCVTDGVGTEGFVDAGGTIQLSSDGDSYTVTAPDGTRFTAHADEQPPAAPQAGNLVIAEFQRDPTKVGDGDGEWLELTGARVTEAVSLNLVQVRDAASDSFTIRAGVALEAGDECLLAADGLPSRNGGIRPILVWPSATQSMSNTSDTLRLLRSAVELDRVDYDTSWPGAAGKSAEREDLLAAATSGNFSNAISSYGLGDFGTPGETNDADVTNFGGGGGGSWVELLTPPVIGQILEMNWHMAAGEAGALYQGWLTLSTTPGITINGTHIPANLDAGYQATASLPGWSGVVPAGELKYVFTVIPNNAGYVGLTVYAIFVTYKDVAGQGLDVRTVATPLPMTIQ